LKRICKSASAGSAALVWPTAIALLLTAAACSRKQGGADVMALVNGRKISRTEVEKYYQGQTAEAPQKPGEEQADTLRLNILKELIDNELLMQRAEKLGWPPTTR